MQSPVLFSFLLRVFLLVSCRKKAEIHIQLRLMFIVHVMAHTNDIWSNLDSGVQINSVIFH